MADVHTPTRGRRGKGARAELLRYLSQHDVHHDAAPTRGCRVGRGGAQDDQHVRRPDPRTLGTGHQRVSEEPLHSRDAEGIDPLPFASPARIAGLTVTAALLLAAGGGVLGPSMAKAQTPWVAPAPEKAKKSPLPNDKKTVEQGEKVTKVNCVACHGAGAKATAPRRWRSTRSRR